MADLNPKPSHAHTLVFWVDGSVTSGCPDLPGGAAYVAEESGIYIMHDSMRLANTNGHSAWAEIAAILLAQHAIETLSDEEKSRACVVTDSLEALAEWWSHTRYRGGAPVFHSDRKNRSVAHKYAHHLANAVRRSSAPTKQKTFWSSCT